MAKKTESITTIEPTESTIEATVEASEATSEAVAEKFTLVLTERHVTLERTKVTVEVDEPMTVAEFQTYLDKLTVNNLNPLSENDTLVLESVEATDECEAFDITATVVGQNLETLENLGVMSSEMSDVQIVADVPEDADDEPTEDDTQDSAAVGE